MFYLHKRALPGVQTAEAFRTESHDKHKPIVRLRLTNSSLKHGNAFSQVHDLQSQSPRCNNHTTVVGHADYISF